jgi:hypothetical protein
LQPTPDPRASAPPAAAPNTPAPTITNRPTEATPPATAPTTPPPADDPYKVNKSASNPYLEAPKLFNPQDRTARNTSIAPVHTAVYRQPVSYRATATSSTPTPGAPATDEQARIDAIGWTSSAK